MIRSYVLADSEMSVLILAITLALEPISSGHLVHVLPLIIAEPRGEDQIIRTVAAHPLLHNLGDSLLELDPSRSKSWTATKTFSTKHILGSDWLRYSRPALAQAAPAPAHQTEQLVANVAATQTLRLAADRGVDLDVHQVHLGPV